MYFLEKYCVFREILYVHATAHIDSVMWIL